MKSYLVITNKQFIMRKRERKRFNNAVFAKLNGNKVDGL